LWFIYRFSGVFDMNLIEQIKNQLSSSVIEQLSSLIGASEGTTGTALSAALPALLSALSGMASSGSGAQKLVSALGQMSSGSVDSLIQKLGKQPGLVHEQGTSLLGSLIGSSTVSGIISAVSRFSGIGPDSTQKLLGYLMPFVLGTIASRFTGKSINTQGLANLFADQKASITGAIPAGFSLRDVPGLADAGAAAIRSATRGAEAASSSLARWLLPLAGVAAAGLLFWWFAASRSASKPPATIPTVARAQSPDTGRVVGSETAASLAPDVTKFSTELTDVFGELTDALDRVKDVASAEAAMPKLQSIEGRLEIAKSTFKRLGDAGRPTIKSIVASARTKLKVLADKLISMPGVNENFKTVVNSIMAKLTDLAE
jgi:hypothetical protein